MDIKVVFLVLFFLFALVAVDGKKRKGETKSKAKSTQSTQPPSTNAEPKKNFKDFTDCRSCVAAGWGWCNIKKICGGFANKECPDDNKQSATPASNGNDMRATFAKYTNCRDCVAAGWGWCNIQKKCGGFRNKECPAAESWTDGDGLTGPRFAAPPLKAARGGDEGTDMSAMFAKYTTCRGCVDAGWGWCPIKKICGGFANTKCPDAAPSWVSDETDHDEL